MFNNKNIFIALTYRCNAFCKKCMTRYHVNKEQEMGRKIVKCIETLLIQNSYSDWISVGTGEPLLYNDFQYFVRSMLDVNDKLKLRLLTNGVLLSEDNPFAIFDRRIKWGVTVDAFNQESLMDLQKGVDIEKVKYNVKSVTKKYGGNQLYLNYTVSKNNIDEILPFCKFAVENNIKEVYLTELKVFSGYESDLNEHRVIHDNYLNEKIDEAMKYLEKNGISTKGINIGRRNDSSKCYIKHNASPMIDVDGSVSFCSGREDIIIGNIMDEDIEKKWISFANCLETQNIDWCSKCYDKINSHGIYYLPKTIRKD